MFVVTGGSGFLGSYVCEELVARGADVYSPSSTDFDLRFADKAFQLLSSMPDPTKLAVINLAALVGGIGFNQNHPYELLMDNLLINTNIIDAAVRLKVKKFVQIGTTCSYPKHCPTPFKTSMIFDGYPEETNAPYGLAKRIAMAQVNAARDEFGFNGITLIPTNLYGPRDNFNPSSSHVIPALIKKFYDAMEAGEDVVIIWGTGKAGRDFLFVEDAAKAIVEAAVSYDNPIPLNIGSGEQILIGTLAYYIKSIIGFKGNIEYDTSKPDGQPKRMLDIYNTKRALNWEPSMKFKDGLKITIEWYKQQREKGELI